MVPLTAHRIVAYVIIGEKARFDATEYGPGTPVTLRDPTLQSSGLRVERRLLIVTYSPPVICNDKTGQHQ